MLFVLPRKEWSIESAEKNLQRIVLIDVVVNIKEFYGCTRDIHAVAQVRFISPNSAAAGNRLWVDQFRQSWFGMLGSQFLGCHVVQSFLSQDEKYTKEVDAVAHIRSLLRGVLLMRLNNSVEMFASHQQARYSLVVGLPILWTTLTFQNRKNHRFALNQWE